MGVFKRAAEKIDEIIREEVNEPRKREAEKSQERSK